MAARLSFLLVLTGLTGIHSITTVSKVSVKAGDSVSIPCLYDSQYRNHVKYLCKGYYWSSCSYAVKTNQRGSGKFSISDDKNQRTFTVTIKDLTYEDTDYWCAVEIDGGADVREYFQLSVTGDTPSLFVDHQEITGCNGENITINCYHRNSGEMKWCRLGSSCVTGSSGSTDGTRVIIDTSVRNAFTVTMSGLKTGSSGWYLCVNGDLQMPVRVTVTDKPTTTTSRPTTLAPTDEDVYLTSDLKSFVIPLSLLVFTVMVALFIWFMLKRHRQNKEESSVPTTFAHSTLPEEEVTYSTVQKNKKPSVQAEEELTYSNVEYVRKTPGKRPEAEMKSDVVIYSSVVTL